MSYLLSILFNKLHGKKRLSDIEYLAIKEFGSKLRQNDGEQDGSSGDLATLTANTGKDMYIANAHANASMNTGASNPSGTITVVLKINAVIVDTVKFVFRLDSGSIVPTFQRWDFPFGFKVSAGQVIKIEVTTGDAQVYCAGSLTCFEEDTGVSPAIV